MVLPEDSGPKTSMTRPAGDAPDPERGVHADRAGGDGLDDLVRLVAEAHERAFPELLVDLLDGLLERLELFLVHFDHVVSFKRGKYIGMWHTSHRRHSPF